MSETKLTGDSDSGIFSKKLFGARHVQFGLLFFLLVMSLCHRTALSVAIIAMTDETPPDPDIATYPEWDNADTILSSFFWGYILLLVVAAQLGEYFGPKWFLVGTMIIGSVFSAAIPPMAAALGSTGVMICRVIQGLTQSFLHPSVHNLISRWAPLYERSTISGVVYAGPSIGTVIGMVLTGTICDSSLGWPLAFYIYGGAGVVWAVIFAIFASNSPSTHPNISVEEKMYIESSNSVSSHTKKKVPTPWRSLATSVPLWAIIVTACGQNWGYFVLLTEIPTYMSNVMDFDIKSDSELSSLPYVAMIVTCIVSGVTADRLISNKILTIGTTRKVLNLIGTLTPAAALFTLGFIDGSHTTLATALLAIAVSATAFTHSGSLINLVDLAPNHAGTLYGITDTASTVFSILGPMTVGFFGSDKKDPILWRKVFWLAAGIYAGCGLFHAVFASGEVQEWNCPKEEKTRNESVTEEEIKIEEIS